MGNIMSVAYSWSGDESINNKVLDQLYFRERLFLVFLKDQSKLQRNSIDLDSG